MSPFLVSVLILILAASNFSVSAQMSRKPSPSHEPPGAMDKKPDSKKNSLPEVSSQAEFDSIARVYHQNTPYALPHVMFVIDRRAKNRAERPAASRALAPEAPATGPSVPSASPVALGTKDTERKTIDFSSGQPVVKDSPEDRAALEAGVRDIEAAQKEVTFEAAKK